MPKKFGAKIFKGKRKLIAGKKIGARAVWTELGD
jgi:hypothetical protein